MFIRALEKVSDKITMALRYLCMTILGVMLLLGTADVMGRYLFNSPVFGTYEIFGVFLPCIVLLGLAYTQAEHAHVNITMVLELLPPLLQRVFNIITTIIAMVITILIGWFGYALAIRFWNSGKLIDTILVPKWIPQLVVPLGALALFLVLTVQLIDLLVKPGKRD
jgi:TRAP-type C4-dicarboxylate transport system permease small subunit